MSKPTLKTFRKKCYCEYTKKELDFLVYFPNPEFPKEAVIECPVTEECRGEKGCALYEAFWFDGEIATTEQRKLLKEANKTDEGWIKLFEEWKKDKIKRR